MIGRRPLRPGLFSLRLAFTAILILVAFLVPQVHALEPIELNGTEEKLEITRRGVAVEGRGDRLQIDTAAGADGVSRRMSVQASVRGTDPSWIVFALRNTTDKPMERWITVQRYSIIGSGVIWPDLDARRLEAMTPSVGFVPQRIENDRADIFKVTLEPGQTVTYAAELATNRFSRMYLWKPLAYEFQVLDRHLFNGIMLGIAGLLGVFITAIFAANHKAIFPSAALLTWCVLAYLCVDFGFWHKLLQLRATETAVYRAATEAAMATSFAIFLHTFLRLGHWHGFVRMLSSVWIIANLALVFVAVLDPRLASTFARLSFAALGVIGTLLTLFLALRGQDRALSLIPTWMLFLVWLFGATMTLTGKLNGDLVVSGLVSGLVLIVVLIGFTVTQFAFRSVEPHYGAAPSEQQLRSLAVEGAGAAVWEWHARRDEIKVGSIVETALGLNIGELSSKVRDFVKHLHPADQERFNVLLWSVQEKSGGVIRTDFRIRHADNSYRWFDLEAASMPTSDRRSLRCVGLLRDVTDQKRAQMRLMHDAVNDSLTGLPNRELFVDRLKVAVGRTRAEPQLRPMVIFLDLDKFKSMNMSFGPIVGDSLLLTIARRLSRHLGPQDTLARLGGDRFAMLILSESGPRELGQLAERLRRAVKAPIKIAGQDIIVSGSIGIAAHDQTIEDETDLLRDAEVAMYRAKRKGPDQIEIFTPDMRSERDDRDAIEADLRRALERQQIKIYYQPIIYLPTEELAGFEAIARWEHPKHGVLNPYDYLPSLDERDLVVKLGVYLLTEAVEQAARLQKQLPRMQNPLFVSVNISSRKLFHQDLIQEFRHIVGRQIVPDGVLRLEVAEAMVMENPEQATEILELLKAAGAELCLDDFGAGYSSLAYLERLPFDTIKISRDLLQAPGTSGGEGGSVLVRSIVAMAKEFDRRVIADGIEYPEDVSFLRSIGCQFGQGYYYGEPMGDRDVTELLRIVRKSERKSNRRSGGIFGSTGSAAPATEQAGGRPRASPTGQPDKRSQTRHDRPASEEPRQASPQGQSPSNGPPSSPPPQAGAPAELRNPMPNGRAGPDASAPPARPSGGQPGAQAQPRPAESPFPNGRPEWQQSNRPGPHTNAAPPQGARPSSPLAEFPPVRDLSMPTNRTSPSRDGGEAPWERRDRSTGATEPPIDVIPLPPQPGEPNGEWSNAQPPAEPVPLRPLQPRPEPPPLDLEQTPVTSPFETVHGDTRDAVTPLVPIEPASDFGMMDLSVAEDSSQPPLPHTSDRLAPAAGGNGRGHGNGGVAHPPPDDEGRPGEPDYSSLPPSIAESLSRLAKGSRRSSGRGGK